MLLPNKRQESNQIILHQLPTINPRLNPKTVLIDYEQAAKSVIHDAFPNAIRKGCFYHQSQAIYRKVQSEGLQAKYQRDDDLALKICMVPALAFIPSENVADAFEELQENMAHGAAPITDYFEDVYIGRVRHNKRAATRFPINVRNMHQRVVDFLPRTINSLDGWHSHLQASITSCYLNIWTFPQILKKEQALTDVIISQILSGHPHPSRKRRCQDLSERIATIVKDYENREALDFFERNSIHFAILIYEYSFKFF